MSGKEKRRVRFASIAGLGRQDLPLAAEIWYEDVIRQIWSSRDVIKIALVLTRYMAGPDDELISVGYIERSFNLDVRQTLDTMRQLQMFGAVEAYSIKDNLLHASLCLSLMQRLRTLETRARIAELSGGGTIQDFLDGDTADHWMPPEPVTEEVDEAEPHTSIMNLVKTLESQQTAKDVRVRSAVDAIKRMRATEATATLSDVDSIVPDDAGKVSRPSDDETVRRMRVIELAD